MDFAAPTSKHEPVSAAIGRVRGQRRAGKVKLRSPELARTICLFAALCAFLLLPGMHVLVHTHEAARAHQTRGLYAAHVTHGTHDDNALAAAEPQPSHQHQHQHQGKDGDGHGRNAPEHFSAALTLAAALPLILPTMLPAQLDPGALLDRLCTVPRLRSHATRASPRC